MKLLFTNNYFYLRGGSERVFFDEAEMLKMHRHEVAPFSRQFYKNNPSDYASYFASPLDYEKASILKKISAGAKLIYSYENRTKLSKMIDAFKPDVVHAHNIYGRMTTSVIDAAKKKQVPVVMTLHDYKLICPSYLMLLDGKTCNLCQGKRFYNCTIKRCHKGSIIASLIYTMESYCNRLLRKYNNVKYFICPSKFLLKKHVTAGIPERKLLHITNFLKIESFEPNFRPGNYVLFVGRLSREKGVLTLLNAVNGLDVQVRIVGDGPMKSIYEKFVKGNKINNVIFEGYRSDEELKALFKNAAFLVFSSEWYENAPMAILEAFAYGKTVIGSDIGGIPEMVIDHETGLLFKPGDHRDLKEKIEYLLVNPSLITVMGKKARKKVEDEHNAELHYKKLMEVYTRALS